MDSLSATPSPQALLMEVQEPVTAFLHRTLPSGDLAEEAASRCLLELLARFNAGFRPRKVVPYALRAAWNVASDVLRARGIRDPDDHAVSEIPVSDSRSLDDLRDWIRVAVQFLKPQHRAALFLRFERDLSYEVIAEVLGLPVGTVGRHLHEARNALRDALRRTGGDPSDLGVVLALLPSLMKAPLPTTVPVAAPLAGGSVTAAKSASVSAWVFAMKTTTISIIGIGLAVLILLMMSAPPTDDTSAHQVSSQEADASGRDPDVAETQSSPTDANAALKTATYVGPSGPPNAAGFAMTVRVVEDATGKAVQGAEVQVELGDPSTFKQWIHRRGRTDRDGRFQVAGCRPGCRPHCFVRARGFAPAWAFLSETLSDPKAGEVVDLGEIRVVPGATVLGTVVDDASGDPVADAQVSMCFTPYGSLGPDAFTSSDGRTDGKGRFRITDVHPVRGKRAFVQVEGYAHAQENAPWRSREDVSGRTFDMGEIRLDVGTRLTGRAFVRSTGAPLARARLVMVAGSNVHLLRGYWHLVGRTGEDGSFAIDHVSSEGRGSFTVFALTPRHCGAAQVTVVKGRRKLTDIEVVSHGSARVPVEVRDAQGAPVVGATVHANPAFRPLVTYQRADPGLVLVDEKRAEIEALFFGRTGADGRCTLPHLPCGPSGSGTYSIVVSRGARHLTWTHNVRVQADTVHPTLQLRTEAALSLQGRVTDQGGNAVGGAEVTCGRVHRATTDADGRYHIEGIQPSPSLPLEGQAEGFIRAQTWLEHEPGTVLPDTDLVLAVRMPVAGRVIDDAGNPVRVLLDLRRTDGSLRRHQQLAGTDGRFRFEDAAEGEWDLGIMSLPRGTSWEPLRDYTVRGGQEDIEIVLVRRIEGRCRLTARVRDVSGAPLDPVQASVRRGRGGTRHVTREMGSVTADGLSPGPWTLRLAVRDAAKVEVPFDVRAGSTSHVLDVTVPRLGAIEATVDTKNIVDASTLKGAITVPRQRIPNSNVWIAGWRRRGVAVAADGTFVVRGVPPGEAQVRITGTAAVGEAAVSISPDRTAHLTVPIARPGTIVFTGTAPDGTRYVEISTRSAGGPWVERLRFRPSTSRPFERSLVLPPGNVRWRTTYVPRSDHGGPTASAIEGHATVPAGARASIAVK